MKKELIIIEDSDEDFEMFQMLFKELNPELEIMRFDDGLAAHEYLLNSKTGLPNLVLLDLNLPEMDGREFLELLKSNDTFRKVPIIAFTTSSNPKDVKSCYESGVNAYVTKPVDLDELKKLISSINNFWFQYNKYSE